MIQEYLEIGPIHTWLPGAMKLRLGLYGEKIQEVETHFGFLSRSIESIVEGQPYLLAQLRFSRVEPESALLLDRLFSEVIEKKLGTTANARIVWIREITTALSEFNGYLRYLARMSKRLGTPILTHIILKHRESLLDLVELLTGSRFGYYYIVPGGVRYDLTEGFQERLEIWLTAFEKDHERIESLFRWTHSFQNRLPTLGCVPGAETPGPTGETSVESRLLYAIAQVKEIAGDLKSLIEERHPEPSLMTLGSASSPGEETELKIETARGNWTLTLSLTPDLKIKKLKVSTPSDIIRNTIVPSLIGATFEDVPVILESLDFSISEIDR